MLAVRVVYACLNEASWVNGGREGKEDLGASFEREESGCPTTSLRETATREAEERQTVMSDFGAFEGRTETAKRTKVKLTREDKA